MCLKSNNGDIFDKILDYNLQQQKSIQNNHIFYTMVTLFYAEFSYDHKMSRVLPPTVILSMKKNVWLKRYEYMFGDQKRAVVCHFCIMMVDSPT